jgi:hypothetical protein
MRKRSRVLVLHENEMVRGAVAGALQMAGYGVEFERSARVDLCVASGRGKVPEGVPVVRLEDTSGIGAAMRKVKELLRPSAKGAA